MMFNVTVFRLKHLTTLIVNPSGPICTVISRSFLSRLIMPYIYIYIYIYVKMREILYRLFLFFYIMALNLNTKIRIYFKLNFRVTLSKYTLFSDKLHNVYSSPNIRHIN
jgi:hypothetical protein